MLFHVLSQDNLPLEGTANVQVLGHELRISNLQQNDIGEYLCMARNKEGSIQASTKVIIAGPAVITSPPRNLTKLEGDKVELICEAKALPSNVTHRWFFNGIEINQLSWLDSRTTIRRDGTLFINPASAEDSGRYTCEVFNGIGTPDNSSAYLNIECKFGVLTLTYCFINQITNSRPGKSDLLTHNSVPSLGSQWYCQMFYTSFTTVSIYHLDKGSASI